jgi:itaconate CoA-transferase
MLIEGMAGCFQQKFWRTAARSGAAHPSICLYGAFALSDGHLVLISIQNEREWAKFCDEVLLERDLPRQPGFESNTIRVAHREAVDARVGREFAG